MAFVKVDISKVVGATLTALPSRADRARIVRGLGAAAMHYWKTIALQQLRSTSRDYVAGLQYKDHSPVGRVEIHLVGRVPNMVEKGWEGGDLRQWLLSGPNARQGKNGPYNTVPFRHATPGTSGRNVGPAMPGSIYTVAKQLLPTLSRPGGMTTSGGRTVVYGQRLRPDLPMSRQARAILNRKEKPWHATSIYMGMIREEKTYRAATQSQYMTFRRISLFSRGPKHWVHPGIKARGLLGQVQKHIEELGASIVASALGK